MIIGSPFSYTTPAPIAPASGRGVIGPASASDTRAASESISPDTARATDESVEVRGNRGEEPGSRPRNKRDAPTDQGLDEQQLRELQELKARDREVKAHEQAHQAVGGPYAGAASYTYQRGPDGNQYAVGGEVPIDISPVAGDPRATIEKMRTVRAAAMAPAQPSGQDRAVAAQAMQIMLQAQMEVARERGQAEATRAGGAGSREGAAASSAYEAVSAMSGASQSRSAFQAVA
ncbi:SprA-related family protein [Marinobacter daqiaonensis]|uniref:SprA-related family protein n=1 Tax=Marinobacter daqiaonensis TaxID=650891 RepID=A0A1I6HCY9_9GAMM|nr:putative metalloprotease CJM1_0395 family protein [Marinobacter daqiaonensis]SFR52309.1 SprA-related family protein [Marinobacter daqiaonensis]